MLYKTPAINNLCHHLYHLLISFINDYEKCFVSLDTICQVVQSKKNNVIRALRVLADHNLINIEKYTLEGKMFPSNHYSLTPNHQSIYKTLLTKEWETTLDNQRKQEEV